MDAPTVDGPREALWRVLVVREPGGTFRIDSVQEFDVAESIGAPVGPADGEFRLAGVDTSGAPVDVQFLRFDDTARVEFVDSEPLEIDMSAEEASVMAYVAVDASITDFVVVDGEGVIVFSSAAPAPGAAREDLVRTSSQGLIQASPLSACAHVMVLDGPLDSSSNPNPAFAVASPTSIQLAVVRSALGRMSPLHCSAVGRIAFVHGDVMGNTGGWVTSTYGDTVFVNASFSALGHSFSDADLVFPGPRLTLMTTILHEGGHSLARMLQFVRPSGNTRGVDGDWPITRRRLGTATLERARIIGDVINEWTRLHVSFVDQGWAAEYSDSMTYLDSSVDVTAAAGFMSHYAAKSANEDFAEFIAWPIVADLYREAGIAVGPGILYRGYGCEALTAHSEENIPSALAAVYTKLSFVYALGAIREADFQRCTGDSVGLPEISPGFAVFEDDMIRRVFTRSVEAHLERREIRYVFTAEAHGTATFADQDYEATFRLELDKGTTVIRDIDRVSWPRGAFSFGLTTGNSFTLRLDEQPAGNFDVTEGFVLVTSATNDRIEGSVYVTEAFRFQAPVPVPQVFDPPLQVRFILDGTQ